MLKTLTFSVFLFLVYLVKPQAAEALAFDINAIQSPFSACVRVFDAGGSFDRQSIRFFNSCGPDLFINACVIDVNNRARLFRSGSRIDYGGSYTISSFDSAQRIDWAAGTMEPIIPGPCSSPQQTNAQPKYWWDKK